MAEQEEGSTDGPVCSPKAYVSNEEAAVARAMRALRERAEEVRQAIATADDSGRRALELELEGLRRERGELEQRRERASRRKMVMLGHLPPEALDE